MKKNIRSLIIITVCIIACFYVVNGIIYPNKYDNNISIAHSWLDGSTIKFVNNWLKDGASNLNFIMYEAPDSIETSELSQREPYISYPSGSIVLPYLIAKICSMEQIDILFLKYMVTAIFAIDSLLIGILIYSILNKYSKNINQISKVIISIIAATFWMLLPNNSYYLRNIYFADQTVITVVLIFMIFEINKSKVMSSSNKIGKVIYNILYYLTIIIGTLTEYYFLFVLFVAFCIKELPILFAREKEGKFKKLILTSLEYIIPLIIGLGIFLIQISRIDGWFELMFSKYVMRTSVVLDGMNLLEEIQKNIISSYTTFGYGLLIIGVVSTIIITIVNLVKVFRKNRNEKLSNLSKLLLFIYIPPVFQILFFKNHSAIHEFSILKLGLPLIFTAILIGYGLYLILNKLYKIKFKATKNSSSIILTVSTLIVVVVEMFLIIPRTSDYMNEKVSEPENKEIEYYLKDNAKYDEVYFSYTYEIPTNPPQNLSISNKQVYLIEDIEQISEKFPDLSAEANIMFIIQKNIDKTEDVLNKEQEIKENSTKIKDLENYEVYELVNESEKN